MTEDNFEGTLVLEKLAEIGKIDEFFDAVDKVDFARLKKLMTLAGCDTETIMVVLKMIADPDGEH